LGVNDIAFTKVNSRVLFKGIDVLYESVIVLSYEMDEDAVKLDPSKETNHEIHSTYFKLGDISNKLANYLRGLGFNAEASPSLGGDASYVPLAMDAGMGYAGKHGLLISAKVGPRQRLACVFTNIENLTFNEGNNHQWIKEFCKTCKKCVRKCLGNAIHEEDIEDENGYITSIDFKKCAIPFAQQHGCTICIKECLFNMVDYEVLKANYLKKKNN